MSESSRGYSPHEEVDDSINWQQLGRTFRRRLKILLLIFSLVFGAGLALTFLSRPLYESSMRLLVNVKGSSNIGALAAMPALNDVLASTGARSQDTEVEILLSREIENGSIARLKQYPEQVVRDGLKIDVRGVKNTDLVEVSVVHPNPTLARQLATAMGAEYIAQKQEANSEQYRLTARYVSGQLKVLQLSLARARQNLENYKKQVGITDIVAEGTLRNEQYATLLSNLRQATTERAATSARLERLRAVVSSLPQTEISSRTEVPSALAEQLRKDLAELESRRSELSQEFTDTSPEVTAVQAQISEKQRRLNAISTTQTGPVTRTPNPVRLDLVGRIAQTEGEEKALAARETKLRQDLSRAQTQLGNLPSYENRLSELQTDMNALLRTYQSLSEQYQTLRVSEAAPMANARAFAASESEKVSPRIVRNIILFLILGLMLGAGAALLAERVDDHIYTEEDAQNATRLPVMALVPLPPPADSPLLLETKSPALLESYRMLRTNIQFSALDAPMRVLVVTSSQPHEGKSTTALNLAITFALNGRKVILVDCDLRRPSIHSLLGIHNKVGFTDLAMGTHSTDQVIQPTQVENLFVVTAGLLPPNPPEFLDSLAARNAIRSLADVSEIVIVDTPPAIGMTDAKIMATMADGVLLVVGAKDARNSDVARTSQSLLPTGKMLGVVLNKVNVQDSGYAFYNQYDQFTPEEAEKPMLKSLK